VTNTDKKTVIKGLVWLSERRSYPETAVTGDTYPMTWADDNNIYTSSGDPMWGRNAHQDTGMDVEMITGDPENYRISRPNLLSDFLGFGGAGPKPSGMICVDGNLYLAAQNLCGSKPPRYGERCQHGSDAHVFVSKDHGITWSPGLGGMGKPMFPGCLFGGPAFVNFGRNNEHARDSYVYAASGDQWDNGCEVRMGRVPAERIQDRSAWEWVSEVTAEGDAVWTADLELATPILSAERSIGLPEVVYLHQLKRYLLLTWRLHQDFRPEGSDLYIYEAAEPWGPYTLVYSEEFWEGKEVNPYCPRIPLKWMEPDGVTGWIQFSGNWRSPYDRDALRVFYRSNVRKFRLLLA
jgi:hypothetical protein